jgi:hypothetical protein
MTREDLNRENMFLNIIFDKNQQIIRFMDEIDKIKQEKDKKPVKETN